MKTTAERQILKRERQVKEKRSLEKRRSSPKKYSGGGKFGDVLENFSGV